jgi:hypothetical protein
LYKRLEGIADTANTEPNTNQFITIRIDNTLYNTYLTELEEINSIQTVSIFNNQFVYYIFTRDNIFQLLLSDKQLPVSFIFIFNNRYSVYKFHNIIPDSRTASILSAGESQLLALQKRDSSIQLDTSTARNNRIRFGKSTTTVKSIVQVSTFFSIVTFYIVPTNILFFLYLQDIDTIGIQFDNFKNILIQGNKVVPVVQK